MTTLAFEDPGGMTPSEKRSVLRRYDELNRRVKLERLHPALRDKRSRVGTAGTLQDEVFHLDGERIVELGMRFSVDGRRIPPGEKLDHIIVDPRQPLDHRFVVKDHVWQLFERFSGRRFTFRELCREAGDETEARAFLQTLAEEFLLQEESKDGPPSVPGNVSSEVPHHE